MTQGREESLRRNLFTAEIYGLGVEVWGWVKAESLPAPSNYSPAESKYHPDQKIRLKGSWRV